MYRIDNIMLPDFPKFKKMLASQQSQFFRYAVKQHLSPELRSIPQRMLYEGSKTQFNYSNGIVYESEYKKVAGQYTLSITELKNSPDTYYEHLNKMAKDFADQQTKIIFDGMSSVTEAVGNVVSGELSVEKILESYEKVEITFDNKGNPYLPQLIASPEMIQKIKILLDTPEKQKEFQDKLIEIIKIKKKIWYDREDNRKLVG